jgi:hypothetical protein
MSTQNNKRKLDDAYGPTFDLHWISMTEVFSHVQCVKDPPQPRSGEQVVEEASKTAAAYPLRFDFGAFPDMSDLTRRLSSYACWTTTKLCLYPTRESLDFLVKLRTKYATTLLCGGV